MTDATVLHHTLSALIQTSLAPVFLLTAIGSTLILIDARQNRIVERLRTLEAQVLALGATSVGIEQEIAFCLTRVRRIGRASAAFTLAGMGIALTVAGLFIDAQVPVSLAFYVEAAFTLAMLSFVAGLAIYLRDVFAVNDGLWFMHESITAKLHSRRNRKP